MRIGSFLNTLISFVTIAAAIFFVVIKPAQRLMPERAEEIAGPSEVELLTEIRDELRQGALRKA
jgi:large conductance mechanosensitive channel